MRAKRPQKVIAGHVAKGLDKVSVIRGQRQREMERHTNAVASIGAQRSAAAGIADPGLKAVTLAKLAYAQKEELARHGDKIADYQRRERQVWDK